MYSKKINQLATNLNPQETDLIPIGDAETGQLKTTTFNAISGVSSDGVISGGIVTWTGTGLNFNISACTYILNGVRYVSPFTTKTLAAADPTNPRIDVFAVNTSGQVEVIQGTPNANPVEPEGDTPTTLGLTNVTINAGATTPNAVTKDMIYDENVETWTKTQSVTGSFNYNDTAFPYTGSKALLVTMSAGFADFRFSKATAMDITTYKSLSFAIRLNTAWTGNTALAIQFYNGTRLITNTYQITANNTVGFNRNLAGTYQLVTIPLNGTLLRFSQNTFTAVRIYTFNAAATYRLDTISLNGGINNPTGGGTTSANSFGFVNGSTGSAASTQATDTLNVVGTGLATTSATGKTLTIAVPTPIPSQTGNTGKFLTTDGSVVSWGTPTDTGITSLNGLGATTQTFATGTSGTDFGISSASDTHTFNLPTASATNRGALSSADWSTFNGKQGAITLTTTGTSGAATLVGNTLNIPQYGGGGMSIGGTVTSGTIGSVLFVGTSSALAQDNANFFWDDNNNRLGIGTATPSNDLHILKTGNIASVIKIENSSTGTAAQAYLFLQSDTTAGLTYIGKRSNTFSASGIINSADFFILNQTKGDIAIRNDFNSGKIKFAIGFSSPAQLTLTSAGRLLLGTTIESTFLLDVNGQGRFSDIVTINSSTGYFRSSSLRQTGPLLEMNSVTNYGHVGTTNGTTFYLGTGSVSGTTSLEVLQWNTSGNVLINNCLIAGGSSINASAQLQADSTTKGFLPPRMTTTQKNAIATPAAGLIVYDTTDNKHYGYNGTTWNAFF